MTTPQTLTVLRLAGSEEQMGHQHGAMVRELGGRAELARFYPEMAAKLLSIRTHASQRAVMRAVLQPILGASARRLTRARQERFPELMARARAGVHAAGMPAELVTWLTVMDVFQNTIGRLGRLRVPQLTGLRLAGIPMCSSLAAWGRASDDGTLRHARNFDFPGIGLWDAKPAVVLCRPDTGLRYGFVTSLGVDLPGITGFNEAGITVTAHTRMHVDVDPDGVCIGDLGHELVRKASTIDEAVALATELGAASTWGLLVSSAREKDAVVIETTGKAVRVVRRGDADFTACTNRYQSRDLSPGEILTSTAFGIDSDSRMQTLERAGRRGGLTAQALQELLAETRDPSVPVDEAAEQITGSCIASPLTVQSVVVEPELGQVRVAAGRAPTARGPWQTVSWDWDGDPGIVAVRDISRPVAESGLERATQAYVEAARLDVDGAPAGQVRARLHTAAGAAPTEPQIQFLGALAAMGDRDLELAGERLERGLVHQRAPFRRAQLHRWAAKVADARRAPAEAAMHRRAVHTLDGNALSMRSLVDSDAQRPATRQALSRVVPDVLLVDA